MECHVIWAIADIRLLRIRILINTLEHPTRVWFAAVEIL
jgi:hypothetical protein